jgi:predicted GH43/DUF377 family glycosyl hydrolase
MAGETIEKGEQVSNLQLTLERFENNPILKPDPAHLWETKAVFNPAAIYEDGKVHILYRAIGDTDVSVLGYAASTDGLHITERLEKPAYIPREIFEGVTSQQPYTGGMTGQYISGGGGFGGCEDPRLTRIGKKVYMTYVAYDGHSPPRVALSSINLDDFLARRWYWNKPVLISPPYIVDKNACILPEKINNQYVIFHRVFPNILIDFVDDLDFDGKTRWLEGQYKIPTRALSSDWDSLKVGCGPPPLKTKDGWLLIYQAVGSNDESRYKIGAMLLDLKDPTKVLARTKKPVLEPLAAYENDGWKSGVVYPCGAAVIKDRLFVYYGGADMVVCVASTKLNSFMEQLTTNHKETKPVSIPVNVAPACSYIPFEPIEAYCLKCNEVKEIKKPQHIVLKNLKHVVQGICPDCGRKLSRFVKGKDFRKNVTKL